MWGGNVGKCYYGEIARHPEYKLTVWIDSNAERNGENTLVKPIDFIREIHYDAVLLATSSREIAESMKASLLALDVPAEKIIWELPQEIAGEIVYDADNRGPYPFRLEKQGEQQ